MIFVGCSFTWGQGLYYYSELNHIPTMEEWSFDYKRMTDALINYKNVFRYPRLVANHFNTFEVCKESNGGSDDLSIKMLEKLFDKNKFPHHTHLTTQNFYYDDISYVIFQTTQTSRSGFEFTFGGKNYLLYASNSLLTAREVRIVKENGQEFPLENGMNIFYEWCFQNNITPKQWIDTHLKFWTNKIKETLLDLEKNNIKTIILCWPPDYMELIKEDDFLNSRLVSLNYNNEKYDTIQDLMVKNQNLMIEYDFENFENKPPQDRHPSRLCHQIIAQSIIEKIENEK